MNLLRKCFCATAIVTAVPLSMLAQNPTATGQEVASAKADNEIKQLLIHKAGQPDPMLRYRFWPAAADRKIENATPLISRAVILSLQVPQDTRTRFAEKYEAWSEMPIDQLPVEEIRTLLSAYERMFQELGRAENLMLVDYPLQLDDLSAAEIVQTVLPEFQEARNLARLIALRAKLAIREQRWDDMVRDCRLGFRLAEVTGRSTDFLIGRLVGFAISGTMLSVIETAIQQPECPNLYWALASLPSQRLFETRESLEFESILISRLFRDVGVLPDQPIGPEAARKKLQSIIEQADQSLFESSTQKQNPQLASLFAGSYVVMMADASRDLLASTEQWGDRAHELSAPEAVLRATILKYSRARDHWVAWSYLPIEVAAEYEKDWSDAYTATVTEREPLIALVQLLTPAMQAARAAGRRSEQNLNWLITIEALRMHAADRGELPTSLERLRPVPAWQDSIVSRPFEYVRKTANEAVLKRAPRYPNDPESTHHLLLKGVQ